MFHFSPTDTFHSRLRHWSVTSPDTPAFIFVSETRTRQVFTRREFYSLALRTSSWLQSKGAHKGSVVAICCPVCPEHLLVMAGATLLGAVSLSLTTLLQDGQDVFRELLLSDATVLVVDPEQDFAMMAIAQHLKGVTSEDGTVSCDELPSLKHLVHCHRRPANGQPSFLTIIRDHNEAESSPCDPDDVITYFSTSGTTASAKLVPRSHREVLTIGQQLVISMGFKEGDVVYNSGSVAWVSGYIADFLVGGFTRVSDYLQDSTPDDFTKLVWQVLVQEQPTAAFVKPSFLRRLADRCAELRSTCGTWKTRVMATGSYPVTLAAGLKAALGNLTEELRVVYGTTEAGASLVKVWTDPSQVEDFNCGTPLPNQEVRLVDENDRVVKEANTRGLLAVRSDVIFKGYLQQEDQRKACVTDDGWYRTGDTTWRDSKGDYFVEGRSADHVIVLGMKVSANLLDNMLHSHPAVEEVAVVGVPDPDSVSRPCLCVICKRNTSSAGILSTDGRNCPVDVSEEELLEIYKENFHHGFAVSEEEIWLSIPKHCLFFDKFPHSWNGKLQRKELRAIVLKRLGLLA